MEKKEKMKKLSDLARIYARSYGQPPYGHEIEGTAELLLQMADKLEEYEDLGLEPNEIKPYIELAEKMNVCDLVRENKRLTEKIMFLEVQLQN